MTSCHFWIKVLKNLNLGSISQTDRLGVAWASTGIKHPRSIWPTLPCSPSPPPLLPPPPPRSFLTTQPLRYHRRLRFRPPPPSFSPSARHRIASSPVRCTSGLSGSVIWVTFMDLVLFLESIAPLIRCILSELARFRFLSFLPLRCGHDWCGHLAGQFLWTLFFFWKCKVFSMDIGEQEDNSNPLVRTFLRSLSLLSLILRVNSTRLFSLERIIATFFFLFPFLKNPRLIEVVYEWYKEEWCLAETVGSDWTCT